MSLDNLSPSELPQALYLVLLLITLVSSVVFRSHLKASQLIKQAVAWVVIALVAIIIYSYRYDFYDLENRITTEIFPSKATKISDNQIAINIANDGHFYIDVLVNQTPIRFMIDTGASDIVLSVRDTRKSGVNLNNLSMVRQYQTANGMISGAITTVDKMEVSGLVLSDVTVSINDSNMGTSLLGMSFLNRFKKYEFYQDRLVLTY